MRIETHTWKPEDIIKNLRSRRVINATGTMTSLGGNVLSQNVLQSIGYVSDIFVNMKKLSEDVNKYIAKRLGVESAYVTQSASASIVLSVAALVVRLNGGESLNISPVNTKDRYVAVQKMHKSEFRRLVELSGVEVLEFGTDDETMVESLEKVLLEYEGKLVGVLHFVFDPLPGSLSLEEVIRISHSRDVPVIVDAAAELPPKTNLTNFVNMGADLVAFSGGKMIGSLSNSGILLGKSELIELVSKLGPLNEEIVNGKTEIFIGRPMKVSKETLVATVTALDEFLNMDEVNWLESLKKLNAKIISKLNSNPNILKASIAEPKWYHPRPAIVPRVEIILNKNIQADEFKTRLEGSKIPIYVYTDQGRVYINPQCLKPEDIDILTSSITELAETILDEQSGMNENN